MDFFSQKYQGLVNLVGGEEENYNNQQFRNNNGLPSSMQFYCSKCPENCTECFCKCHYSCLSCNQRDCEPLKCSCLCHVEFLEVLKSNPKQQADQNKHTLSSPLARLGGAHAQPDVDPQKKGKLQNLNNEKILYTNTPQQPSASNKPNTTNTQKTPDQKSNLKSIDSRSVYSITDTEKKKPGEHTDHKSIHDGLIEKRTKLTDLKNRNKLAQMPNKAEGIIKFQSEEEINQEIDYDEIQDDIDDSNVPQYKKKTLANIISRQFEEIKLKIDIPKKIESTRDGKFVQDKTEMAKNAENLQREIKNDKFNDKRNLAKNIYLDFDKQDSWQSYTTLLYADAEVKSSCPNASTAGKK